jgi:hypothetical protein
MITGYNTDIRHVDMVIHVQTEDKGRDNPFLESVIYVGGRVVTTKRSSYAELLAEGKGDPDIAALLERQHRTMLAAIKAGRFDDKLEAFRPAAKTGAGKAVAQTNGPAGAQPETTGAMVLEDLAAEPPGAEGTNVGLAALATDKAAAEYEVVDEGPTLDQVILDYLSTEAENEQLILVVDGQDEIRPGKTNLVTLRAYSSKSGLPLAGVQVAVKMLSTIADPRTLLMAETDDVGALEMQLDLPTFSHGSAALIISGSSNLGRAEIKQLL